MSASANDDQPGRLARLLTRLRLRRPRVVSMAGDADDAPVKLRRTWPQRLTIVAVWFAAFGCFAAGSVLYAAQRVIEDRNVVVIDPGDGSASADGDPSFSSTAPADGEPAGADGAAGSEEPARPVETFPPAEPDAKNFLITGADNNSCIDPDSPYAGAFGDRSGFGERSDTIMMWRVNPSTSQVAVLSFPRDLWVNIAGRSSEQRINVAYERDRPQRLIDTIYQNFLIPTDHFIQIDFCAFRTLVEAVDGVAVPFDQPVRDGNTGLNVPTEGCFTFDGDHALAYVRSRHLEYLDEDGKWQKDRSSDLGRISRQQDFIRRTVDSLLAAGAFDPSVIRALIRTSDDYVVNDADLTVNKMLEFAGVLKGVDPASITNYQIEARNTSIQGNQVLIPRLGGGNMQSILRVFRGDAALASAPEQVFEPDDVPAASTTTELPTTDPATTEPVTTDGPTDETAATDDSVPDTTAETVATTTLPEVEADDIIYGIVPDSATSCR
ncbi:MAG: hypothetical protein HKN44_07090 [Ilumatobacter sp.]|nr:hypothetical protein [Ilumatobacter sp.]